MPKGFEIASNTTLIKAREDAPVGGALPKWWTSLSDESREEYVAEHPNSKYADIHKQSKGTPKTEHAPGKDHASAPKTEHKPTEHAEHSQAPSHTTEEMQPKSKVRTKAAKFLKSKAGSIVSHVKGEAKEWKAAGSALNDLRKGKKLDTHAKKAIASVATDVAILTTAIVSGGGAAHGVVAFLKHFGAHFLQDVMIKSAVKGVIHHHSEGEAHHASVLAAADPTDQAVKKAMAALLKMIESGDLAEYMRKNAHLLTPEVKKELGLDKVKAAKIEAQLDMSTNTFDNGVCPDCKGKMIKAYAGGTECWTCPNDRIALPLRNT